MSDIDLHIGTGEYVAINGPSGCGKSTLLRLASGLLQPSTGDVRVDRDTIGYVFQDATLLPWRTVQRNVELLAELHEIDPVERERLLRWAPRSRDQETPLGTRSGPRSCRRMS